MQINADEGNGASKQLGSHELSQHNESNTIMKHCNLSHYLISLIPQVETIKRLQTSIRRVWTDI